MVVKGRLNKDVKLAPKPLVKREVDSRKAVNKLDPKVNQKNGVVTRGFTVLATVYH